MNSQHTHSKQKISAAYFKDVKTEEAFSNQDCLPQSKSASATFAYRVDLMNGTTMTMNTSR